MSTAEEAPVGRIENLHFARLLARMWERGFTGSFRAHAAVKPGVTVSKEILFERGRVAWAASDDPEESIRVHLINRGILQPDQWRLAEEKAGSAQARQTLLELGFLSARELQEADRERVTAIVLSLFPWREGRYESAAGTLAHGTPNLKIDPRDLVLEGLMSSGDRGRVLDEIGTLDARLVVRPDDLVRASLSLPVELVGLMGKADGTRTIADVCALSPLPDFLISAAFAGLKVLGLARPLEGAATVAPPAPPTPAPDKPPVRKRAGRGSFGEEGELDPSAAPTSAPDRLDRRVGSYTPPRRRSGKDALDDESESDAPSELPLEDDHETIRTIAMPPGGTPATAASALPPSPVQTEREEPIAVEGYDTASRPVVESHVTPPMPEPAASGVEPAAMKLLVRTDAATKSTPAAPERSARADAVPKIAPAMPATPAQPTPTAPALMATHPQSSRMVETAPAPLPNEDEDEAFDREAEVELTPGIPVIPVSDKLEHTGAADLRADEIEDVIDVLDAPFPEEEEEGTLPAGDEASGSGGDDLRSLVSGEDDEYLDEDEPVGAGEAIDESGETVGNEETEEIDDADQIDQEGGESPLWVYQPSDDATGPARSKRWTTLGAVAVGVIGLAAGVLFIFGTGGNPESRSGNDAVAAESEAPDVLAPAAFTPPAAETRAPEPARPSPSASASFNETPRPLPSEKTSRTRAGSSSRSLASPPAGSIFSSGSWKAGRRLLTNGSYEEAARRFDSALSGRPGLYTVQLALACEPQTIARALRTTTGASELFILPTTYQGRSCYRLLWGAYSGKSAALAAKRSVPGSFLQDPNPPKVTPL